MKIISERGCSYCGKVLNIYYKKRMEQENVFCSKQCEGSFRTKAPNTRCVVCKKPLAIKNYRLKKLKNYGPCCSKSCSSIKKKESYLGKGNPNHKHDKNLNCFYNLSNDGAYILGLIYSDGNISSNGSISIFQKHEYKILLKRISYLIFNNDLVVSDGDKDCLTICDKNLVNYIVSLGGIVVGKKSRVVEIPNIPEDKKWAFICGYFDGDGSFKYNYRYPEISITSNSDKILEQISKYWEASYNGKNKIYASGFKALDICGKMYDSCSLYHPKKRYYYEDILNWEPFPNNGWYSDEYFKCKKLDKDAFLPKKSRPTDSGYDVTALEFIPFNEDLGVYIADMRVAVEPSPGWYFDLLGRSSLPKNNLHFLGGVGVIDRSYTGSLKMFLQKININMKLPEVPFRCGQLIPRKCLHAEFIEVEDLLDSSRGNSGFGSSGE